jgi:peptidoglycan/xylan/chitin deacetylase (PgdA/CDA1 family)
MSPREPQPRRRRRPQTRRRRVIPARLAALGSLIAVAAVLYVVVHSALHSNSTSGHTASGSTTTATSSGASGAGHQGTATVPILVYRVINSAPSGSSANPDLYVPTDEFSSQMSALKAAGWHAVTLDQLEAYWTRGTSLGSGKPIVITFDDGYASQYTNALPVLKGVGWVAVVNLPVNGLPVSEGGLTDSQIRALLAAGWELGSEGISNTDLTMVSAGQLHSEVAGGRQMLSAHFGVPVNWFSYPDGQYNPTVTAEVQAAGFFGATTVNSGWASPQQDRFRLPRIQVVPGTTGAQLLSKIAAAQSTTTTPTSYNGPGVA